MRVELAFRSPEKRRRDPTDYFELTPEALTGAVYKDEGGIVSLAQTLARIDRDGSCVEITIASPEAAGAQ